MRIYLNLLCVASILLFGTAGAGAKIKATTPNTELVEAEGMGPIINGDIASAKQTSLSDALKNSLGLVIGVYVSQEALTSKAALIEDNITSQSEGYIEKYEVISESKDDSFYKTKIRAVVRKEDLSAKLKALELEPKKLGNPVVKFEITETIDGNPSPQNYAANELKNSFVSQGFVVSDSSTADILITGTAESKFNTDKGLGGLTSYRGIVSLKALKGSSQDVITAAESTAGGVDVTKEAASKNAIVNGAKKISKDLPATVLTFLKEHGVVQLSISKVENINVLNDFTRAVRALIEVRDCWVRNYSGDTALIDLDLKKGNSTETAKRLEQMTSFKVIINKTGAYDIVAELVTETGAADEKNK
ncbi:MAG TPA: hypothetical protein DEE98_07365 [Elusimicrobia bacterium]|nr:MAG: hypothetical protein A2278_01550 [Elusimicrobia bacterium RIFOXYA12_FULL_49_49]OGS06113.1 MAG: hypothetical protein A2204_01815 [Elusimicrobia bacterium RIFOXYA1_FULL_47_7]OGS10782.1 MAG: hypothetical protein A2386_06125 [Elusimicrobia bacterium RIFOXYB1_FULL_48_9]OGS16736.1 MAG: hypothetical protein A2251_05000 [Elusimicrobia bacterium RIFOXYA2_FULL_47_53]OGS27018.1 MAG: hypothetical protein A2339_04855 [Elusimicrobia bacterium RIFOXYB12_FULL_50_12]OGS31964.1 MAG: hypothetical protein